MARRRRIFTAPRITVQIRSVNHRHLDLQVRTPREYMSFEEEIRKLLREKISRGRIDLFVNRYVGQRASAQTRDGRGFDRSISFRGRAAQEEIQTRRRSRCRAGFQHSRCLSCARGRDRQQERTPGGAQGAQRARSRSSNSRASARGRICAPIWSRRSVTCGKSPRRWKRARPRTAARQQKGAGADGPNGERPERNNPDVSTAIAKGDINEELVRLKTHVVALAKVVREREPVGKKVDFMLQEVNRELNTISSKVALLAGDPVGASRQGTGREDSRANPEHRMKQRAPPTGQTARH